MHMDATSPPGSSSWPHFSIIVSTIGADDDLPRLIRSLDDSDYPGAIEVVIVDQSADLHVARLCETLDQSRVRIVTGTSPRGVSRGRNEGIRLSAGDVFAFPDDDTWFAPDSLRRVACHLREPGAGGVSGRQVTADGKDSMLRWAKAACGVSRTNWPRTSISSTMFLTRQAVDLAGDFDESIGAGTDGWLGSGEETDLLLRVIDTGATVPYDPAILVYQSDPRQQLTPAFVEKMSRYGAGMGHLFRVHRLPAWLFLWIAGRKVASTALSHVRGKSIARDAQLAFVRGMIVGVTHRPPNVT